MRPLVSTDRAMRLAADDPIDRAVVVASARQSLLNLDDQRTTGISRGLTSSIDGVPWVIIRRVIGAVVRVRVRISEVRIPKTSEENEVTNKEVVMKAIIAVMVAIVKPTGSYSRMRASMGTHLCGC